MGGVDEIVVRGEFFCLRMKKRSSVVSVEFDSFRF